MVQSIAKALIFTCGTWHILSTLKAKYSYIAKASEIISLLACEEDRSVDWLKGPRGTLTARLKVTTSFHPIRGEGCGVRSRPLEITKAAHEGAVWGSLNIIGGNRNRTNDE